MKKYIAFIILGILLLVSVSVWYFISQNPPSKTGDVDIREEIVFDEAYYQRVIQDLLPITDAGEAQEYAWRLIQRDQRIPNRTEKSVFFGCEADSVSTKLLSENLWQVNCRGTGMSLEVTLDQNGQSIGEPKTTIPL